MAHGAKEENYMEQVGIESKELITMDPSFLSSSGVVMTQRKFLSKMARAVLSQDMMMQMICRRHSMGSPKLCLSNYEGNRLRTVHFRDFVSQTKRGFFKCVCFKYYPMTIFVFFRSNY